MRALLVHNPTAGEGTYSTPELLIAALRDAGYAPVYCSSKSDDYRARLKEPTDIVVVAGGDGTVAKVVRHLPDRNVPIAILPIGTANNVARSLGIPDDAEQLATYLCGGRVQPLDIGVAAGKWGSRLFVEAVGLGALAKALYRDGPKPPLPERKAKGREALRKSLQEAVPQHFELVVDGEKLSGDYLFVEVLNLCMTGPTLRLGAQTHPSDRLLNIVCLTEAERPKLLAWLDAEPEQRPAPLETKKGNRVEIRSESLPLRIDDRIYCKGKDKAEGDKSLSVELDEASLLVCIPQAAESAALAAPNPLPV